MIIGAHIMLQSRDDKADQAFLTEVLKLGSIEAEDGFFIFGLPPAQVAIHEADKNEVHLTVRCANDINAFVDTCEASRHLRNATRQSRLGHVD